MIHKKIIRSPFFYVGDKYKLMPQLKQLMHKLITAMRLSMVSIGKILLNINLHENGQFM